MGSGDFSVCDVWVEKSPPKHASNDDDDDDEEEEEEEEEEDYPLLTSRQCFQNISFQEKSPILKTVIQMAFPLLSWQLIHYLLLSSYTAY